MENNKNGNPTIPLSITLTLDSRYYLGTTRDGVHFRKIADQETVAKKNTGNILLCCTIT